MLKRWVLTSAPGATVLAGTLSTYAQRPSGAVTDHGRNVYTVDATQALIANLLPTDHVARIKAPQQGRSVSLPPAWSAPPIRCCSSAPAPATPSSASRASSRPWRILMPSPASSALCRIWVTLLLDFQERFCKLSRMRDIER